MKIFFVMLMAVFIGGCEKINDYRNSTIGNQEINCLRVDLGISNEEFMERVSSKKKSPDLDLIKRIHLPANASLCEIRDFVDLVLYSSQNQSSYIQTDPQVNMIKLAVNNYEEEFLPIAKAHWHSPNSYVTDALIELLSDESKKDTVRKNIANYPWLIQVVVKNGWSQQFREEIEKIIIKSHGKVSYNYGAALAQIDDPNTENMVLSIFKNGSGNRHITYKYIKDLDWLDPIPTMQEIWLSDDVSDLELQYFSYPLIRRGFLPALDFAAQNIDAYASNSPYQKNYQVLNAVTNQSLEKDNIRKWVIDNRDKLKFDPKSKQYYVAP